MEDLIDLIATNASASDINDHIKNILYTKAAERVEYARPEVAASMFGSSENGEDQE